MRRRQLITRVALGTGFAATLHLPLGWRPAQAADQKYRFGFSQATILETWRVQFNKDMKKEAEKHPELELIITDGQNKTEKQVADVENLISQGVDVLLDLAQGVGRPDPGDAEGDRGRHSGDHPRSQRQHRQVHAVHRRRQRGDRPCRRRLCGQALGGAGKAKGNVVEIWGGFASAPAHDRSDRLP